MAIFNPATGPPKVQTYDSQGAELTTAPLRRPASQQESAALGFCSCPALRDTCPFPHLWQQSSKSQPDLYTQVMNTKVMCLITRSEKVAVHFYSSLKISLARCLQNSKQM